MKRKNNKLKLWQTNLGNSRVSLLGKRSLKKRLKLIVKKLKLKIS